MGVSMNVKIWKTIYWNYLKHWECWWGQLPEIILEWIRIYVQIKKKKNKKKKKKKKKH